jgi:hypothetical protein
MVDGQGITRRQRSGGCCAWRPCIRNRAASAGTSCWPPTRHLPWTPASSCRRTAPHSRHCTPPPPPGARWSPTCGRCPRPSPPRRSRCEGRLRPAPPPPLASIAQPFSYQFGDGLSQHRRSGLGCRDAESPRCCSTRATNYTSSRWRLSPRECAPYSAITTLTRSCAVGWVSALTHWVSKGDLTATSRY